MTPASTLVALVLYAGAATFVAGTSLAVGRYARTPQTLSIPTTPAPVTRAGVALRLAREVFLFESLFKASPWTWLFGWLFHASLALVLLGHLRYFTEPLWTWLPETRWLAPILGIAMLAGLAGLLARRIVNERVRYVSAPSDFLMLVLLIAVGASGMSLGSLDAAGRDGLRDYAIGLLTLDIGALPAHPGVVLHLVLVAVLLAVFPFSKLLHAPGLFFSPTRVQPDRARERRAGTAVKSRAAARDS